MTLAAAEALAKGIDRSDENAVAPAIMEHAEDQLGYAFDDMSRHDEELKQDAAVAGRVWSLVLTHPSGGSARQGCRFGRPRLSNSGRLTPLCVHADHGGLVFPHALALKNDPSVAVRFAFANKIGSLWAFRRKISGRLQRKISRAMRVATYCVP